MTRKRKAPSRRRDPLRGLRDRLEAAEEALRAIRAGEVDALVVARAGTEHVITLAGAELAYRALFDQMNEGAVTLTRDGTIAYCNRRFAEILRTPLERVLGAPFGRFVPPDGQAAVEDLHRKGSRENARGDFTLRSGDGSPVPVAVSFAPLYAQESAEVIGLVGVISDITERRRDEELRKRLIEQAMSAQDEERRRIARELHDETGQSLTALLVGLRTIEKSRTRLAAAELAEQLRGIVARTLEEVGRLSRGLHPSTLDELGLAAAVTRHVEEFNRLHGVDAEVRIEGLGAEPLPPLLQTSVYRVLQEALTNVAKHAGARTVSVRLARDESTVNLLVRDDGIGLDPAVGAHHAARGRRRLGLKGMRERAALLGGSVEVESRPGAGTSIKARFPVRGA